MTDPIQIRATGRSAAASPLRYPGGKAALARFFSEVIAALRLRGARYVEPYAGGVGAGISLLRKGLIDDLVINDIDPAVYSFWISVTTQPEEFARRVRTAELDVEEWRRQKAIYRAADEDNTMELGFAFFYLNRTNRSGILNAGPICGVNQNGNYKIDARYNREQLAERVLNIGALADRITVLNLDGMAVVREYAGDPNALTYIDPPYVDMGGSLYLNSFSHRDHADLAQLIDTMPDANWVITYDPSDFIRKIYAGHDLREYALSYSAHKPGEANELLVLSTTVAEVVTPQLSYAV